MRNLIWRIRVMFPILPGPTWVRDLNLRRRRLVTYTRDRAKFHGKRKFRSTRKIDELRKLRSRSSRHAGGGHFYVLPAAHFLRGECGVPAAVHSSRA